MSSYRKPEIQKDLPKITKVKLICFFFTKTLTKNPMLISADGIQPYRGFGDICIISY